MQAYKLIAYGYKFDGTDSPSRDWEKLMLISKDRSRLEEVEKIISGGEKYGFDKDRSSYCASAQLHGCYGNKSTMIRTSFGTIAVPNVPIDQYYGDGSLLGFRIEEFEYITPEEFV